MNFLDQKYVVVSVIGSHAGEDISPIFMRKNDEIERNGKTYWLIKSFKARTSQIQELCKQAGKEGEDVYCIFITASSKNGARPTTHEILVQQISENVNEWITLAKDVKITGKIDKQSTALVLSNLEIFNSPVSLDLWDYSELDGAPVKLQLGASSVCCIRQPSTGMKSRIRNVAGWAKLISPFAVWVK